MSASSSVRAIRSWALAAVPAFEVANLIGDETVYELHFVSEHGGPVGASAGMNLETEAFGETAFDTLIIGGGNFFRASTPGLIARLREASNKARRVAAICTGAFVLGEAGLLDGRRVTTHWMHARELQEQFPNCTVDVDRIFINDGPIWTSAGMSAGIDLALALVEADLGQDAAQRSRESSSSPSSVGGPVPVLGFARTGAEIGSCPIHSDLRQAKPPSSADGRGPGGGRAPQPPSV